MIERWFWFNDTPAGTTDFEYCSFQWPPQIKSSSSGLTNGGTGTTATAAVASGRDPFGNAAVGDILLITQSGTVQRQSIATKTSDNEVIMDSALDLSAGVSSWALQKRSKGTAVTDGWQYSDYVRTFGVKIYIATIPTGGVTIQVEVRNANDQNPSIYWTQTYSASTDTPQSFLLNVPVASVRVGLKRVSAGSDGSIYVSSYADPSK